MPGSESQTVAFGSVAICGFSTSFIILAVGVSCLVISIIDIVQSEGLDKIDCGERGNPPLPEWVFGTGIAFLIISCAFALVGAGKGGKLATCIVLVSNVFIFIWAIVGAVSLWKYGADCEYSNLQLWRMGYAAVILSFIVCCCGGFIGYKAVEAPDKDAEIVREAAGP